MIRTAIAAFAAFFFVMPVAFAAESFSPAGPTASPQQSPAPTQQAALPGQNGIDALFTSKFDAGGGQRDCHDISVGIADDKYIPVAVLLPVEGNEPPAGEARTVMYKFEAVIDPTTARMSPSNSVIGVQQCTFGQSGQSVWFKVDTKRVMNSNVEFFGTTIPLTADQVTAQVPIQVSLKSGTYKGRWVKVGDNQAVVFAKQ